MGINLRDTFAVDGNTQILFSHLDYYESQIEARQEHERSISESPNYYAWLSLTSHLVYYRISELLYFNDKNSEAFDCRYKVLIDKLITQYGPSLSEESQESIILFAKIRQLLVHKGFPNYHNEPSSNNRAIGTGIGFNEKEVDRVCDKLQSPNSYWELKAIFRKAIKAMNSLQIEEIVYLR